MKLSLKSTFAALLVAGACVLPAYAANYFANDIPVDNVVNPGRVQPIGEVEVIEFFWYGCPHCAAFEPYVQDWAKQLPQGVKFIALPASWNESMTNQQRLYFTLEALNRLDLHDKVFIDIHKKHKNLNTPAQIEKWAVAQKINAATWRATYNSAAVTQRVIHTQDAYKRFELSWVPAIVINGKRVVAFNADILKNADAAVQEELKAVGQKTTP